MSVDDENTIYVGDLPYDCTDNLLHQVFELYGSIISVKIINNRDFNGSCFGYVTFTNPRSAVEAIEEMNGKTIGGRVVRVNVKSKSLGMRSTQGRGTFRQNQRNTGWVAGRVRGRGREKVFVRDSRREYSREHDGVRERWIDRSNDHPRHHFQRRDRDQSRETPSWEHVHSRSRDREPDKGHDLDSATDTQLDSGVDYDRVYDRNREQRTKRKHSSSYESYDRPSTEHSSEPSDHSYQEEQSDIFQKRQEEIQIKKSVIEQKLEEKKHQIADLQTRTMKLEDALTSSRKRTSMDQLQLTKLSKCSQQVKEYGEKLESFEREFQDLVDSVSKELDPSIVGPREIYLKNGED